MRLPQQNLLESLGCLEQRFDFRIRGSLFARIRELQQNRRTDQGCGSFIGIDFTGKRFLNHDGRVDDDRLLVEAVAAGFTNGGENFVRNPTLEAFGAGQRRSHDQGIQATLIDAVDGLMAAVGVDFDFDDIFGVDAIIDALSRL